MVVLRAQVRYAVGPLVRSSPALKASRTCTRLPLDAHLSTYHTQVAHPTTPALVALRTTPAQVDRRTAQADRPTKPAQVAEQTAVLMMCLVEVQCSPGKTSRTRHALLEASTDVMVEAAEAGEEEQEEDLGQAMVVEVEPVVVEVEGAAAYLQVFGVGEGSKVEEQVLERLCLNRSTFLDLNSGLNVAWLG